ncbi:MAG: peptidylprolyl isomerase [Cruoricaptor ignavus]|nr:peptidylprolyl isomerase [Cruoricaptor ignavus]
MKKIVLALSVLAVQLAFSQYMIVGKDSVSLKDFKEDNLYGLQNVGVDKTIESTQDFILLQQLAAEKKVDTLVSFQNRMYQKAEELRDKYYFPQTMVKDAVNQYVNDNKIERNILIFTIEKKEGDNTDYQKVYNDVVSGKLSMEDAIKTYVKEDIKPMYIKPGVLEKTIYDELKKLSAGGYTKLYNSSKYATFAKVVNTRPSLGYMIFGTLSYPNNADAEKKKNEILAVINSGKKFNEITAEFGTSDNEKKNGGVVMGSPTLPDEVYNLLKTKKIGDTAGPILFGENYFFFHIYDLLPYEVTEQSQPLFRREMMNSNYADDLRNNLIDSLVKSDKYKEFKDFSTIKSSYTNFKNFKNNDVVLYQFGKHKMTFAELKKQVEDLFQNLENISNEDWAILMEMRRDDFIINSYSADFELLPEVKKELETQKRLIFSEYIFSEYLKKEVDAQPNLVTEYYSKNKAKYIWDERADSRIAIVSDEKELKNVQKQIKDIKNWENLKKQYSGKLNDKNQILVHFEQGKIPNDAEVFVDYKLPFKPSVNTVKIGDRTLVIAVDSIIPKTQMTQEEAKDLLYDAVTEEKLREIIAKQRAKTKIVVEPEFRKDLEKNFKK